MHSLASKCKRPGAELVLASWTKEAHVSAPVLSVDVTAQQTHPDRISSLKAIVVRLVGVAELGVANDALRLAMIREALARTRGNYTRAADLLGVRRQAVQQMVSRFELADWVRHVRSDVAGDVAE
jgi:transcriptional regulator with PAS, ATPase and Fis domain